MEKYELTEYQWKLIEPLIPPKTSICGRARRDSRELIMDHGTQHITTH